MARPKPKSTQKLQPVGPGQGKGNAPAAVPVDDNVKTAAAAPLRHIDEDTQALHNLGYAQELARRMSGFSNFAISFSIICILAGGITALGAGFSAMGGDLWGGASSNGRPKLLKLRSVWRAVIFTAALLLDGLRRFVV